MQRSIVWCLVSLVPLALRGSSRSKIFQLHHSQAMQSADRGDPVRLLSCRRPSADSGQSAGHARRVAPAGEWVRRLEVGLALMGLCALFAVAAWAAATWLPQASAWQHHHVGERSLLAIVTFVAAPILQSLAIGTGLYLASCTATVPSLGRSTVVGDRAPSIMGSIRER
jgi:hypothetical protein